MGENAEIYSHCEGRESKLEISFRSLFSEFEKTCGRWRRKIIGVRGDGVYKENVGSPLKQLTRAHRDWSSNCWTSRVSPRSSAYMLRLLAEWFFFNGTPNCGSKCVFDYFACSWDSFLPTGLSLSSLGVRAYAWSYCVLFLWCFIDVSWRLIVFWREQVGK